MDDRQAIQDILSAVSGLQATMEALQATVASHHAASSEDRARMHVDMRSFDHRLTRVETLVELISEGRRREAPDRARITALLWAGGIFLTGFITAGGAWLARNLTGGGQP